MLLSGRGAAQPDFSDSRAKKNAPETDRKGPRPHYRSPCPRCLVDGVLQWATTEVSWMLPPMRSALAPVYEFAPREMCVKFSG
jgi:hypothetical protein